MKKILILLLTLQAGSAFADTQIYQCQGEEKDELSESVKVRKATITILDPSSKSTEPTSRSLEDIGNIELANNRMSVQIGGLGMISIYKISYTNMKNMVEVLAERKDEFYLRLYIPVNTLGATGQTTKVNMTRVTESGEQLRTRFTCQYATSDQLKIDMHHNKN